MRESSIIDHHSPLVKTCLEGHLYVYLPGHTGRCPECMSIEINHLHVDLAQTRTQVANLIQEIEKAI